MIVCPVCKETYKSVGAYLAHLDRAHPGTKVGSKTAGERRG